MGRAKKIDDYWDGDTHVEVYQGKHGYIINETIEDDDDIPEGCAACGGDWPNCTDGCPLYDD